MWQTNFVVEENKRSYVQWPQIEETRWGENKFSIYYIDPKLLLPIFTDFLLVPNHLNVLLAPLLCKVLFFFTVAAVWLPKRTKGYQQSASQGAMWQKCLEVTSYSPAHISIINNSVGHRWYWTWEKVSCQN